MILPKMPVSNSSSDDQHIASRGLYMIPMRTVSPRNVYITSRSVARQQLTGECGGITFLAMYCCAYRLVSTTSRSVTCLVRYSFTKSNGLGSRKARSVDHRVHWNLLNYYCSTGGKFKNVTKRLICLTSFTVIKLAKLFNLVFLFT